MQTRTIIITLLTIALTIILAMPAMAAGDCTCGGTPEGETICRYGNVYYCSCNSNCYCGWAILDTCSSYPCVDTGWGAAAPTAMARAAVMTAAEEAAEHAPETLVVMQQDNAAFARLIALAGAAVMTAAEEAAEHAMEEPPASMANASHPAHRTVTHGIIAVMMAAEEAAEGAGRNALLATATLQDQRYATACLLVADLTSARAPQLGA